MAMPTDEPQAEPAPSARSKARDPGDFDLRTFSIRAYPVDKVPELRSGMSAYLDWRTRG
jgi:hypothetical protein